MVQPTIIKADTMQISMIVAHDNNRAIGGDNKLLWHIPEDLKRFKAITMGKPIVMGRKTYESIGRPLPGRENVVITRSPTWSAEGVTVLDSLQAAYNHLSAEPEIMIIGGGQLYEQCLEQADRLYVTEVDLKVSNADTWFPALDLAQWQQIACEKLPAKGDTPACYFIDYSRR